MPAVYLGLGSNIEAPTHVRAAIRELQASFEDAAFSPVYHSPAMGFRGDDFLNLAARIDTDTPPLELADWLREVENRHGRDRSVPRWSSRTRICRTK